MLWGLDIRERRIGEGGGGAGRLKSQGRQKKGKKVKEHKAHWSNTKGEERERTFEVRVKLQISAP